MPPFPNLLSQELWSSAFGTGTMATMHCYVFVRTVHRVTTTVAIDCSQIHRCVLSLDTVHTKSQLLALSVPSIQQTCHVAYLTAARCACDIYSVMQPDMERIRTRFPPPAPAGGDSRRHRARADYTLRVRGTTALRVRCLPLARQKEWRLARNTKSSPCTAQCSGVAGLLPYKPAPSHVCCASTSQLTERIQVCVIFITVQILPCTLQQYNSHKHCCR